MTGNSRIEGRLSRILVALLILTAGLTIVALQQRRGYTWANLAGTSGALAGHVLFLMAYLHVWRQRRVRWLMAVGMALSAVSMLAWLYVIWNRWAQRSPDWEWVPLTIVWHFALAIIGLLAIIKPNSSWVSAAKVVSSLTIAALVAMISATVLFWPRVDIRPEVIMTGAIAAIVSTLLVPLLNRSMQRDPERNSGPMLRSNARCVIECPRCALRQSVAPGESRCIGCRLKITVEFEEPSCECGYPLFGLTGEKCPECGREIPGEDRWRGGGESSGSREG